MIDVNGKGSIFHNHHDKKNKTSAPTYYVYWDMYF